MPGGQGGPPPYTCISHRIHELYNRHVGFAPAVMGLPDTIMTLRGLIQYVTTHTFKFSIGHFDGSIVAVQQCIAKSHRHQRRIDYRYIPDQWD